jgi:hypothetical protein
MELHRDRRADDVGRRPGTGGGSVRIRGSSPWAANRPSVGSCRSRRATAATPAAVTRRSMRGKVHRVVRGRRGTAVCSSRVPTSAVDLDVGEVEARRQPLGARLAGRRISGRVVSLPAGDSRASPGCGSRTTSSSTAR